MDFGKPNVEVGKGKVEESRFSEENIKKNLYSNEGYENTFCCMFYGADGSGKSGCSLSYMSDEDIKNGCKAIIIDLDGGNEPLLPYHKERCEKAGKKVKDVFIVKNPMIVKVTNNDVVTDYIETFAYMKAIINYVKNNWKEDNIKYVVFDGLTTALSYAEYQMRLEKNIAADGGVSTRYWLRRNRIFLELLEQIKSIPISKFFIGHENFVLKDNVESSKVIEKTNAMMHHKIRCIKSNNPGNVTFKAIIDKSKYNIQQEGKEIEFAKVDKDKYKWEGEKVFKNLI